MFSTLVFETYVYDFLLLMGSINLLMFNLTRPGEEVDLKALGATGMKYDKTH